MYSVCTNAREISTDQLGTCSVNLLHVVDLPECERSMRAAFLRFPLLRFLRYSEASVLALTSSDYFSISNHPCRDRVVDGQPAVRTSNTARSGI